MWTGSDFNCLLVAWYNVEGAIVTSEAEEEEEAEALCSWSFVG